MNKITGKAITLLFKKMAQEEMERLHQKSESAVGRHELLDVTHCNILPHAIEKLAIRNAIEQFNQLRNL